MLSNETILNVSGPKYRYIGLPSMVWFHTTCQKLLKHRIQVWLSTMFHSTALQDVYYRYNLTLNLNPLSLLRKGCVAWDNGGGTWSKRLTWTWILLDRWGGKNTWEGMDAKMKRVNWWVGQLVSILREGWVTGDERSISSGTELHTLCCVVSIICHL